MILRGNGNKIYFLYIWFYREIKQIFTKVGFNDKVKGSRNVRSIKIRRKYFYLFYKLLSKLFFSCDTYPHINISIFINCARRTGNKHFDLTSHSFVKNVFLSSFIPIYFVLFSTLFVCTDIDGSQNCFRMRLKYQLFA